jgi:hypothetical protein
MTCGQNQLNRKWVSDFWQKFNTCLRVRECTEISSHECAQGKANEECSECYMGMDASFALIRGKGRGGHGCCGQAGAVSLAYKWFRTELVVPADVWVRVRAERKT